MGRDERMEMIHAELDGDLGNEQRADLARALLPDPQLRTLRDDLQGICKRLEALTQVEAPPELKDSILERLPSSRVAPTYHRASSASFSRWRLAAMVAGLLIAGAIVFETMQGPTPASRETVGTLAAEPRTAVGSVAVGDDPVTGRATLYRDRSGLAVGLEVSAAEPVDVVISSGSHSFRINGLKSSGETGYVRQTIALPGVALQGQDIDVSFLVANQTVSRVTLHAPTGP